MSRKVIISCAVTGSIHTPSMSPHLPVTATEIAESALAAAEAGAAIVHLHARHPQDGRPDQSPEAFEPFLRIIKQRSNVVVNLTTGGSPYMTVEERIKPAAATRSRSDPPSAVAMTQPIAIDTNETGGLDAAPSPGVRRRT